MNQSDRFSIRFDWKSAVHGLRSDA